MQKQLPSQGRNKARVGVVRIQKLEEELQGEELGPRLLRRGAAQGMYLSGHRAQ